MISSSQPKRQSFVTEPPESVASAATTVNLAPLGLGAFAVTTFVLSAANAGLFSEAGIINSLILLYACSGLVQLIAGVHTLWTGKTLVGTALCSYGAFWLTIAGSLQFGWIPNATALGYFLLGWTIFTGLLFLSTLRHSRTFIAVFGALLLTFLSLTIAELGGGSTYGQIGGWLGMLTALITAVIIWYIATHRPELPAAPAINPIPLGLSAFALTTFVVSALNAGLFFGAAIFIGLALFYGGLVEIIAGVQAFKTGHTFGAIAFCSNGGFWLILSFGIWQHLILSAAVVGYLMVGWIIFAIWAFVAALKTNIALIIVSVLTVLTLLALAVGNLGGGFTFTQIGGWLGLLLAVLAWYTALAFLLAGGRGSFVLPVGLIRRG